MARRRKPDVAAADIGAAVIPPPPAAIAAGALTFQEGETLRRVLSELAGRRMDALSLYTPLPVLAPFHADGRKERLVRGSNRAGKTMAVAAEVARAVTGQDPFGKWPKRNGKFGIVGLDGRHLADPIYQLLFRAGTFLIIRDEETGQWRSYHPERDLARKDQAKPAPPLIPPRFVVEIGWEDKKRKIPAVVRLSTGWELFFYTSNGNPPNGIQLDGLWIDEEILNEAWWGEMVMRLADRKGRALWSATPQVASESLWDLHVRSEEDPERVAEYHVLVEDNPFIDAEEKLNMEARLVSEEERAVRLKGEFARAGFKVYPEFSMSVHGHDMEGPLPADWARFAAVDPGRQVCAVLFGAVPPPHKGRYKLLLYDELYIKACDAETFGRMMRDKMDGVQPEVFLIDSRAGRVNEMGSGLNIELQYAQALKKHRVRSALTGSGFLWGADDPKAGILAVHELLRVRECGSPTLAVAEGRLPRFEKEIKNYHHKRVRTKNGFEVTDEPEKKNDHLMDCLRYLAMYRPQWSAPKPYQRKRGKQVAAMMLKLKKRKDRAAKEGGGGRRGVRLG